MPQPTEQYVQVWRVTVADESLYWRTSAKALVGEKPINARLELASVEPVTFMNWRLENCTMGGPFLNMGFTLSILGRCNTLWLGVNQHSTSLSRPA